MKKLVTLKTLKSCLKNLKKRGKKIVFTNGCFDILHFGHVAYLKKCRALGDILVVGLNSDSSVKKIKGKTRPVNRQIERGAVLSALQFVDYVVIFTEKTPENLIRAISPSILAKGGDWRKKDIVGNSFVKKSGGKTVVIPYIKGFSTTRILERLKHA